MAIIFKDSNTVEVDGVNAGDIVSVISNYPARKAEILKAFQDFRTVETTAHIEEIAAVKSEKQELETKVVELEKFRPYDPRIINSTAFFKRISLDEFAKLSTSDDENMIRIAKTIVAYKDNNWPVVFESPELQQMIGYLLQTGFLSEERSKELLADASQDEAYKAG